MAWRWVMARMISSTWMQLRRLQQRGVVAEHGQPLDLLA